MTTRRVPPGKPTTRRRPKTRPTGRVLRAFRLSHIATIVFAVLVAAGVGVVLWRSQSPVSTTSVPPPAQFFTAAWSEALGGDQAPTGDTWTKLADLSRSDLGPDAATVAGLAGQLTVADLTGTGRDQFAGYWPDPETATKPCSALHVLAANPARLPATDHQVRAKVLVVYTGSCDSTVDTSAGYVVTWVYAERERHGWQPVREWQLPGSTALTADLTGAVLNEWDLRPLSGCGSTGNTRFKVRIMVAEAWEVLCADAERAGVHLEVTAGYRSPSDQAALFAEAVRYYGSEAKARRHVAFAADGSCSSRHCAGLALDVAAGRAREWLTTPIGCVVSGRAQLSLANCPAGAAPVRRLQRYGFIVPSAQDPDHVEFTLPIPDASAAVGAQCSPAAESVPAAIAAVFRCRLQTAGVPADIVRRTVAEAETIAQCESGWNTSAKAYGGRYATEPHPSLGRTFTEQGLFMIPSGLAAWVPGGAAKRTDPVASAHAAASIWLAQRSWASFGCATGHGVGAGTGPVLPEYGGSDLPDWAYTY